VTVFHELAANRKRAAEASKHWAVYRVCKNGQLAKTPSAHCATLREADEKAAYLTSLNPGSTFEAVAK